MSIPVSTIVYVGYDKFFRQRLLVLDAEKITELIDQLDKETHNIRLDVLRLCWYMRGGITYEEAMQTSQDERKIINEIIKDNLETTKKTQLPFF
jgi:hypothetical protein